MSETKLAVSNLVERADQLINAILAWQPSAMCNWNCGINPVDIAQEFKVKAATASELGFGRNSLPQRGVQNAETALKP